MRNKVAIKTKYELWDLVNYDIYENVRYEIAIKGNKIILKKSHCQI